MATAHGIAIRSLRGHLRAVIGISIVASAALTAISLLRYEQNISLIPEVLTSARGFPFVFLTDTYFSFFRGYPSNEYSLIISNLIYDYLVWFCVSLISVASLWVLSRRGKNVAEM